MNESSPWLCRKLEVPCLDDCCIGRQRHSRFKRSQCEHRGRCSLHLTFLRRHVKQPDLDLGGRRGVGEPAEEFERIDSFMVAPFNEVQ